MLVDSFEAGYAWNAKSRKGTVNPNPRRPLKDSYSAHGQNCVEYIAQMFGPATPSKKRPETQQDPYDRLFFGEDRSHAWMA